MKGRFLMATLGSLAALSPISVSAESATAVEIHAQPCAFSPVEVGTWGATGAINDSGTYARTDAIFSPPNRPIFSPINQHETFQFTGSHGTFTIEVNEQPIPFGTTGEWHILPLGTDDYADTSGHGDSVFQVSPGNSCAGGFTVTLTFAGVASKVS